MSPVNQHLLLVLRHETALRGGFVAANTGTESLMSATRDTAGGDRGIIYRAGPEAGLIGIFDFSEPAAEDVSLGYSAWGRWHGFDTPVPRAALLADEGVREVFLRVQGRRRLPLKMAARLIEVTGAPPHAASVGSTPEGSREVPWLPPGRDWASEQAMETAILARRRAWRTLGFERPPRRQKTLKLAGFQRLRCDLTGDGLVAELKLAASAEAIDQLCRYLRHHPPGTRGVLVVGSDPAEGVRRAVEEQRKLGRDIALARCSPAGRGDATIRWVIAPCALTPGSRTSSGRSDAS